MNTQRSFVLAFDTANEVIAIGLGKLDAATQSIECVASVEVEARRASNTQLLPRIDERRAQAGVGRGEIACVAVGRGPGSFTGVRIALACAKGIASALEVGLVGVSSLDAVAWGAWKASERGSLLVVADAMRREVYPVEYRLSDAGVERVTADRVIKAEAFAEELDASGGSDRLIAGDALRKYADLCEGAGALLPEALWTPTGAGLLMALRASWRAGECDPLDAERHDPAFALPVYTRLSDAEENERQRLARADGALAGKRGSKHVTMNDTAIANARANGEGIAYKPLDACHVADVAALEAAVMGTDAWNETLVADELGRADRVWWAAYAADPKMPLSAEAPLVGYSEGGSGSRMAPPRHRSRPARPRGRRRPQPGGAHEFAGSTRRKRGGPGAVRGPRLRDAGAPAALLFRRGGRPHHAGAPAHYHAGGGSERHGG